MVARTIEEVAAVGARTGLSRGTGDNYPLRTVLGKAAVAARLATTAGARRRDDKSRAHYDGASGDHSKNSPGSRHLTNHRANYVT